MNSTAEELYVLLKYLCCPPIDVIPRLVSTLAFSPPEESSYDFKFDIISNKFQLCPRNTDYNSMDSLDSMDSYSPDNRKHITPETDVFFAESRKGNRIACVFWRFSRNTKQTILYSHCNSIDLGSTVEYLRHLSRKTKSNIITYDYSGYGLSDGKPSEERLYADIDAALSTVMYLYDIQPKDIVLFGESIGSAPTIDLSTRLQFKGVILESPIISGLRTMFGDYATRLWSFDPFPNLKKANKIQCKVLIFHGTRDELVDIEDAILLYNRCPHKVDPFWAADMGHNEVKLHPQYYSRINTFINELK